MSGSREERRRELPRRCAWCERFCIHGRWVEGRREQDAVLAHSTLTHTICEDCVERLRREGRSR
jgi:hypothetical protein